MRRRQDRAFSSAPSPREIVEPRRQNRRSLPSAPSPREIVESHRQNRRTLPSAHSPREIVVPHRQNKNIRQFSSISCDCPSYSLHLIKKAGSDSKRDKQEITECNDFCNLKQYYGSCYEIPGGTSSSGSRQRVRSRPAKEGNVNGGRSHKKS